MAFSFVSVVYFIKKLRIVSCEQNFLDIYVMFEIIKALYTSNVTFKAKSPL